MKRISFLIIPFLIASTGTELNACGNSYYYEDRPLPYKDGFLDYHKIFVSFLDDPKQQNKSGGDNPYFFAVGMPDGKWGGERYRDAWYGKLRDTLYKLTGMTRDSWKVSDLEIVNKALAMNIDYKLLSDFAWKLARKNELSTAEKILVTLEKKYPGEYNIIANLGTVYELQNKPRQALQYITKAVQLSPESHYGSEWLHINILKMKTGEMPAYDFTSFFGLNSMKTVYGDRIYEKKDLPPGEWGKYHRDTLMIHLAYQLHERMFFINDKNPVMAEMLYMFLQCMIHRDETHYAAEAAKLCMDYSEAYYYPRIFNALGYCLKENAAH